MNKFMTVLVHTFVILGACVFIGLFWYTMRRSGLMQPITALGSFVTGFVFSSWYFNRFIINK